MYQYLTEIEIRNLIGEIELEQIKLMSSDTYNELKIGQSVNKADPQVCCAIALQSSIIGFGKKTYGHVKVNDKEIDIRSYFEANEIEYKSVLGSKLEEHQLTPRRLIRFFRYYIQTYIKEKQISTYLWRKYCPLKDLETRYLVFPGSEYMIDYNEEGFLRAKLLLRTYEILDKRLGSNVSERITRIMLAKGFSDEEIEKI